MPILGVLALVAGVGCGGRGVDEAGEEEVVNAVEAEMAIDDVRVAGVALAGGRGVAGTAVAGTAVAGGVEEMGTAGVAPAGGAGSAARRLAEEARRESTLQPLVRLEVGEALVVDMEVADAPAGSEVTVVWGTAEGRAVWRQTRAVGDEARLSFSADTGRWPAALYQGAILYGLRTVHRFAVRVGAVPPAAVATAIGGVAAGAAGAGTEGEAVASAAPGTPAADGTSASRRAGEVPTDSATSSPAATSPSPAPAAPAPRGAQPAPDAAPSYTPADAEPAAPQPAPEAQDPIEVVPEGPPPAPPPADEPVPEGDEDEPPGA